jgi:hypothetical protein
MDLPKGDPLLKPINPGPLTEAVIVPDPCEIKTLATAAEEATCEREPPTESAFISEVELISVVVINALLLEGPSNSTALATIFMGRITRSSFFSLFARPITTMWKSYVPGAVFDGTVTEHFQLPSNFWPSTRDASDQSPTPPSIMHSGVSNWESFDVK